MDVDHGTIEKIKVSWGFNNPKTGTNMHIALPLYDVVFKFTMEWPKLSFRVGKRVRDTETP